MKGVCTTTNPLSRFFILWLGVAPNFSLFFASFGPQAVGRCTHVLRDIQRKNGKNCNAKNLFEENIQRKNNKKWDVF